MVQYRETGNVQEDIAQLAQSPGLEWMGELAARDDVDWQAVQEIHDKWSKSDGGLGAGGMLIVAIIISAVTAGTASSLAAIFSGVEVAANGAVIATNALSHQLAMHAALSAAFTSISAQVATSVADAVAGGDLGSNIGNIFSESGLRSLAATMVMASTLSTYGSDFAGMGPQGEIFAKTTVKTLTSTLIEGEGLEGAFRTALGSTFASYAKGAIPPERLNEMVSLILTGATGAAGSALAGGDPVQGALSAMLTELAENIKAPELSDQQKAEAKLYAALSKTVYDEGESLPDNLEEVDLDSIGIKESIMVSDSGLRLPCIKTRILASIL